MATFKSLNNSWQQLYTKGNNLRVPERDVLTRDGVYFRRRPEPEVVEHMLDDLETKMRNYFILYNREREFRKKSEENCYRLEQELLNYKSKLEDSNNKFQCLERKVKSMVEQPMKLKETIDRIDLLYNQMDTLIQAFVGIGSCAVIQGYSRVAFIKLCLEYLYPCRELDVRLNTLYNALYNVLTQYDGIEVTKNEVLKPMTYHEVPEKNTLTGLSVKVHRLMLKCDLPNDDTKSFGLFFRYDSEQKELKDTELSRYVTLSVKPMDNVSKVYEFNSHMVNPQLPPKVPNVVPKLVLDVYADDVWVGSAETSLISDKTLMPADPWNVMDSNGMNVGDVVVTVSPVPQNAKLPAVNFTKTDELMNVNEPQQEKAKVETPKPQQETKPVEAEKTNVEPVKLKTEGNKAFQPKQTNVRKPLFNPKTAAVPKPAQSAKDKPQETKQSNVSKLSMMFGKKNHDKAPEEPKQETAEENLSKEKQAQKEKSSIKDLIIRKLSSRVSSKEYSTQNSKVNETQPDSNESAEKDVDNKVEEPNQPEPTPVVEEKKENVETVTENPPSKAQSFKEEKKEEKEVEQNVQKQPSLKVEPEPKPETPVQTEPKVEKLPSKNLLPPKTVVKAPPKPPVSDPVPDTNKPAQESLPEKPILPVVIAPKLLKKPSPPKKR